MSNNTRSIKVEHRYLHLPVRNGASLRDMTITVGELRNNFTMELADGEADWWATFDLAPHMGQEITIEVLGDVAPGLERAQQSDELLDGDDLYEEKRRPQLRFSARRGWLNDPNGLVFYEGEYHLFYQHNPYGVRWGNMHWGHAVSRDLVHWAELPIALYPDELGPMFSGGAVVDWQNSSGLQTGSRPPLLAYYTAADQPFTQCLAASNDLGRTWQKYRNNPILRSEGRGSRDPKVIWHSPTNKWVMALYIDRYDSEEDPDRPLSEVLEKMQALNNFSIFTSDDLKNWSHASDYVIPGDAECPELFELPVVGREGETRWVVLGAMGKYQMGQFDGRVFTPEPGVHALSCGDLFYAAQTFSDIPARDGRRILIAWSRSWPEDPTAVSPLYAEMPFNQSMGLPVELTLHSGEDGMRLRVNPVRELVTLRKMTRRIVAETLGEGRNALAGLSGDLWEIDADLAVSTAKRIVLVVRGLSLTYDVETEHLSCGEMTGPLRPIDGRIRLHVFVDRTAVDIFGNDGRLYMPLGFDLTDRPATLELKSEGGEVGIAKLDVHSLVSSWS